MLTHAIRRVLPLLTAGALLASAQSFAAAPSLVITPEGNVGVGVEAPTEKLQVNGKIRAADLISNYAYTGGASYVPGTWKDIVAVPHIGVFRVVVLTHWFGYQTGYWEYRAFRGEHPSAMVVKLVDSWTYNNPTVPEVEWNGNTLRWRWSPSTTSGGPAITVTATNLATDYSPTFQ